MWRGRYGYGENVWTWGYWWGDIDLASLSLGITSSSSSSSSQHDNTTPISSLLHSPAGPASYSYSTDLSTSQRSDRPLTSSSQHQDKGSEEVEEEGKEMRSQSSLEDKRNDSSNSKSRRKRKSSSSYDDSRNERLDIEEVVYAVHAFWATLKPVALSLIFSSLAVVYIQSEATRSDNQSGLKVYQINDDDTLTDDQQQDSNSEKFGKSLINAIVIICVIAGMTFVIVFCYWMRCMKFLLGYMIFSSGLLLAVMGGLIWYTAIEKWELPCDIYTFFFILYNFAIVGIIAIFYQEGIPTYVTQFYLICTSVILAWQLTKFDEWTGWTLLVMLALYDLCAVLTPWGPLKMLVGLMQERPNDPLPGLLYEAELPKPLPAKGASRDRESHETKTSIPSPAAASMMFGSIGILMTNADKKNPSNRDSMDSDIGEPINSMKLKKFSHTKEAYLAAGQSDNDSDHESSTASTHGLMYSDPGIRGNSTDTPNHEQPDVQKESSNSIKLGLGDFVFYSVLVARAATYGFAAFLSCFVVILAGLGVTLVLLAVFRQALPALPVSIFLGVLFYLFSRFIIIEFLEASAGIPIYV